MKLLIRILITSGLVLVIAHFMRSVEVADFQTALIVAVVLGLLNVFIKPILVLLTLPVTIISLGLFLFVINAFIILMCSNLVGGFKVNSFWTALIFSIILSVCQSIAYKIIGDEK